MDNNGLSPEIQEALARRGGQQGQTPPQPAPQPAQPPMPQDAMGGGLPPQTPESQIIIKALDGRLKALSKLAEMTGGQKGV